jgi:hypothetical protein
MHGLVALIRDVLTTDLNALISNATNRAGHRKSYQIIGKQTPRCVSNGIY